MNIKEKKFQDRLRDAIGGESVRNFAKRSGVSVSAVQHYLKGGGEPSLSKLKAIARAANVSVAYLAGEVDTPQRPTVIPTAAAPAETENGAGDADIEINIVEALDWARAVLESDTPYRVALYHNLRAFYQAVEKEEKMRRMEQLIGEMLNEIRQMRLEIAELKSSAGTEKRETKVA